MTKERAVFWMSVSVLLGAGFVVGQVPAVMVAATAAACLAFLSERNRDIA